MANTMCFTGYWLLLAALQLVGESVVQLCVTQIGFQQVRTIMAFNEG
jgi:hypothetical protein